MAREGRTGRARLDRDKKKVAPPSPSLVPLVVPLSQLPGWLVVEAESFRKLWVPCRFIGHATHLDSLLGQIGMVEGSMLPPVHVLHVGSSSSSDEFVPFHDGGRGGGGKEKKQEKQNEKGMEQQKTSLPLLKPPTASHPPNPLPTAERPGFLPHQARPTSPTTHPPSNGKRGPTVALPFPSLRTDRTVG